MPSHANIHNLYDFTELEHIFTSMIGFVTWPPFLVPINYYKRWPSDKANHIATCENML